MEELQKDIWKQAIGYLVPIILAALLALMKKRTFWSHWGWAITTIFLSAAVWTLLTPAGSKIREVVSPTPAPATVKIVTPEPKARAGDSFRLRGFLFTEGDIPVVWIAYQPDYLPDGFPGPLFPQGRATVTQMGKGEYEWEGSVSIHEGIKRENQKVTVYVILASKKMDDALDGYMRQLPNARLPGWQQPSGLLMASNVQVQIAD